MADDLKDQVDFMTSRFQDTMKSFEDHENLVKDCIKKVEDISFTLDVSNKEISNLFDSLKSLVESISPITGEISTISNRFSEAISSIVSNHSSLKNEFEISKDFACRLEKRLDFMNDKTSSFAEVDYVKPLYIEIDSIQNELSFIKSFVSQVSSDLWKEILIIKTEMKDALQVVDEVGKQYLSSVAQIASVNSTLESFRSEFKDAISVVSCLDRHYIDDKISQIPVPVIPSIEDATKAMATVLEPVSLDAKNANLRSVNNETKVMILEKRLEQMQLVLNAMKL